MGELVQNIEDLGSIKRVTINELNYRCQRSRDVNEILLEDIDAEIDILNDPACSNIVSPSTEEVVKSSVDMLGPGIMEEITELVNILHEKFELFDNFYSKRLEDVTRNLENFQNNEELAEI